MSSVGEEEGGCFRNMIMCAWFNLSYIHVELYAVGKNVIYQDHDTDSNLKHFQMLHKNCRIITTTSLNLFKATQTV